MKKDFLKLTFAVGLVLVVLASCDQQGGKDEFSVNTVEKKMNVKSDTVFYTIDFPECSNAILCNVIREYINEHMGGSYAGDIANADSMVAYYMNCEMEEIRSLRAEEDEIPFWKEFHFKKTYETDLVVTFEVSTYSYMGGAHGLGEDYGVTFRKTDGRIIGKNVLNNLVGNEAWNDVVKEGLKAYFEVQTDEDLGNMLFDVDVNMIPLPDTDLYYNEIGAVLVYQSYEIGPYAAGNPSVTIPYSALKPYMNVTGQELFY